MGYKLYIDDTRPAPAGYILANTSDKAIETVKTHGVPDFIDFDHDLGGADTAMKFAHWFAGEVAAGRLSIPAGFDYAVHSQNPVGAVNIISLMSQVVEFADFARGAAEPPAAE